MKFPVPKIRTLLQLANLLEIEPEQLRWLANPCGRRSAPDSWSRHYRSHWIRKRSGGWRLIEAPRSRLRYVQRILLDTIFNAMPPHVLAFGFCRNRSVIDFVKPHVGKDVCWRFDLTDFFTSVTTGRVAGLLRNSGYPCDVANSIAMLTTVQTSPRILSVEHPRATFSVQSPKHLRRHLPQGAPTSPAIANLCAYRLDARLSGLARSVGGVCYSRYADDILFSGDSDLARQSGRLRAHVGAIAIEEGFEINYRKTRLARASQRQFAAGIVLNEKLNVPRENFDRLKAILHNCVRSGPTSQNRDNHPAFRQHLEGRVQWVEMLNRGRGEKLRKLLERIEW
ncbi:reverse transcriptase family protein [Mariniblastus fucicola]|uniref:RNA-directed DNA polymerase n=1 Tax=Mariniblastus fucicola TaxID=980251 RepID=A0A5B9PGF8_9BACT|nr:reverse transcriptase family protein [Mariniblastus fucicola]QEG24340.1 Reverse transcriptase (RNA-dependent DNA polymerase) [Mariniblastus fucicola]